MKYFFIRGGSWIYNPQYCRVASRDGGIPGNRNCDIGFRLIKTILKWNIILFTAGRGATSRSSAG